MSPQASDYEHRIALALEDVEKVGLRASARKHSIKLSTLKDRHAGARHACTSHQKELSLSPEQEDDLERYIMEREPAFQPLTRTEIRGFAQQLSEVNGQLAYIGKNWVDRFFTRHPAIEKKPTKVFESSRKRAVTRKSLSDYYRGLEWVIDTKNISKSYIYNTDENGMQIGETNAGIAYDRASSKAMTRRNIISGFSASGIYPLCLQKAIDALKPREKQRKGFEGPTTPRKSRVVSDMTWSTPQGSADIQKQQTAAQSNGIISIRDFNCIIKKMMKSIDKKNSRIQRLEEEKAILKASLAAKEPTGRVTVRLDPNAAFPSIEQIITARDQAEKNILHRSKEKPGKKGQSKPKKNTEEDSIVVS
ncbi:hypothetical protein FCULG_00012580 [Fusarium culmorum]|uniref:HTH CENPB-type domain-containing protein n=1 Tax=Fusarium culmorum TaxID=5516 RepID=A0A2T4GG80_FUSCU|nr:hypothetical protein FCULG_00012580 [Fusarium culmorum]